MIIPAVGALGSAASAGLSLGQPEALGQAVAPAHGLPAGAAEALGQGEGAGGVEPAGGESGGFGGALTEAISSLEKSQQNAASASQALATGTVKDPASAVVTVEDAQMAMQLASQLRTKATEAIQTIFQTQA